MFKKISILIIICSFVQISCQNQVSSPTPEKLNKTSLKTDQPVVVQPNAGKTWNIFGLKIVGKIMSAQTNGSYSVVMSNTPPDGGPPPHVHEHEDELFYVLKGNYQFTCGDQKIDAEKGTLIHLPRGIPHGFKNIGKEEGVLLNTITPGGFENFFEEIDQLPKDQPMDRQKVETIATKYGLKFLPLKE